MSFDYLPISAYFDLIISFVCICSHTFLNFCYIFICFALFYTCNSVIAHLTHVFVCFSMFGTFTHLLHIFLHFCTLPHTFIYLIVHWNICVRFVSPKSAHVCTPFVVLVLKPLVQNFRHICACFLLFLCLIIACLRMFCIG